MIYISKIYEEFKVVINQISNGIMLIMRGERKLAIGCNVKSSL